MDAALIVVLDVDVYVIDDPSVVVIIVAFDVSEAVVVALDVVNGKVVLTVELLGGKIMTDCVNCKDVVVNVGLVNLVPTVVKALVVAVAWVVVGSVAWVVVGSAVWVSRTVVCVEALGQFVDWVCAMVVIPCWICFRSRIMTAPNS